jgi:hypothetical protein
MQSVASCPAGYWLRRGGIATTSPKVADLPPILGNVLESQGSQLESDLQSSMRHLYEDGFSPVTCRPYGSGAGPGRPVAR